MKLLLKDSYLKTLENSVGNKLFRNLYFDINGKRTDILKNGVLSCAAFVSWILKNFKIGPNIAIFILFFGIALIEALEKQNWLGAALFIALGALFVFTE